MPISLSIDFATGDIEFDGDDPVLTDTVAPALYLAIATPRGSFPGDPELGSDIPALVRGGRPVADLAPELESAARAALQPLERAGVLDVEAVAVEGRCVRIHTRQLGARDIEV